MLLLQKSKIITLFLLLLLSITLGNDKEFSKEKLEELKKSAAENYYIEGTSLLIKGDSASALNTFLMSWHLDSTSQFLTDKVASLAIKVGAPDKAVYVITGGKSYKELSDTKLRKLLKIYVPYKHYYEAYDVIKELDTLNYKDSLTYGFLAEKNKKFVEAAHIYSSLDSINGDKLTQEHIAKLYYYAGELDSSIAMYKELYEKYPSDRTIMKGYGLALLRAGQFEKSFEFLKWFLPIDSNIPDNEVMEEVGRFYATAGDYTSAIQLFQFLYTGNGGISDYYYGKPLATYAYLDKRFDYSKGIITKIYNPNNSDFELAYLLGANYEALGQLDSALIWYDSTLAINSSYDIAIKSKVLLLAKMDSTDKAIKCAFKFATDNPDDPSAWGLYGSILSSERMYKEAEFALSKAYELEGDSANNYLLFELAMSYERNGKKKDAEKLFSKVIKRDSTYSSALNYLAYMYIEDGKKLSKAKKLVELALKEEPDNGAYLDTYGWYFYQKKEYHKALEYLIKAEEQIKDDYTVYYHLGLVYDKLGMKELAIKNLQIAQKMENPIPEEIETLIKRISNSEAH